MLTPAVQETLVDIAPKCEIEVVGGRIYFFSLAALPLTEPAVWEWVEDLTEFVETMIDPTSPSGDPPTWPVDESRRRRREALFTAPPVGGSLAIGCLVPLVAGAIAAVASVVLR